MESGASFVPVKVAPDLDAQQPREPVPAVQLEIVLKSGRRLLVPSSVRAEQKTTKVGAFERRKPVKKALLQ